LLYRGLLLDGRIITKSSKTPIDVKGALGKGINAKVSTFPQELRSVNMYLTLATSLTRALYVTGG
jgi:hypothetical protein